MPEVPYTGIPGSVDAAIPGAYEQGGATPASFGGLIGQSLQRGGSTLEQAGNELMGAAIRQQSFINQVATDEAFNTFQEHVYKITSGDSSNPQDMGYFGLHGNAAILARPTAVSAIEDARNQIRAGLNPRQQLEFDRASRQLQNYTLHDMQRHYEQEAVRYSTDTQKASEALALRNIGTTPSSDRAYSDNLAELDRAAVRTIEAEGGNDEMIQAAMLENRTKAVAARTLGLFAIDPVAAKSFLEKNQGQIPAEQYVTLLNRIDTQADQAAAQSGMARHWPGSAPNATPLTPGPSSDPMWSAQIRQESGGRQLGSDGKVLTSPAGALGKSQILPGTARQMAAELGIPYDESELKNNEAYNEQLGFAYKQKMLGIYGGNQTLALAAYNAGPGNVDKWIKQFGDPRTGAISNEAWLAKLPRDFDETRNYVSSIMGAVQAQANSVPPSITGIPNLDGVLNGIDNDPSLTDKQKTIAYHMTMERFRDLIAARNAPREEQAYQERIADKALKLREDSTSKDGWDLWNQGKLDQPWLDQHKADLNQSDYTALLKAQRGEVAQKDDPHTLIDLTDRLDKELPEEFAGHVAKALTEGRLTTGTYQSLVGKNRELTKDDQPLSPYRSARARLNDSLDPGLLSGAGEQMARVGRANALTEFDNWSQAHPQATRSDYMEMEQNIQRRYQIVNFNQISMAIGLPRFYTGDAQNIKPADIESAEGKTLDAMQNNQITRTEGLEELRRLQNWRAVLSQRAPSGAIPKPPTEGGSPNPAIPNQ